MPTGKRELALIERRLRSRCNGQALRRGVGHFLRHTGSYQEAMN